MKNATSGSEIINTQQKINNVSDKADLNETNAIALELRVTENETDIGINATNIGTNDDDIASLNDVNTGAPRMVAGLIQAANLPSYVDDVLEFANLAAFPVAGETGKIYIAIDTGFMYRWSGSVYVDITSKVDSVNGEVGIVVLDADKIAETNTRYWDIKHNYSAIVPPSATDDSDLFYELGSTWFDSIAGINYLCQDATATNAVWIEASGSGDGGGVGSSSIFGILNADNDLLGNWTNVGAGALSFSEINPLNGSLSYLFVAAAANNETERTIPVALRSQDKYISAKFQYTLDQGVVTAYLYNGANLLTQLDLEPAINSTTAVIETQLTGVANLTIKFKCLAGNETFKFDDIEFNDDPFSYKNLNVVESYTSTFTVVNSSLSSVVVFNDTTKNLVSTPVNSSGNFIITILKDCLFTLNAGVNSSTNVAVLNIRVNRGSGLVSRSFSEASGRSVSGGSFVEELKVGNSIVVTPSNVNAATSNNALNYSAIATTEHLIQATEDNGIGSIQAFGTLTTPEGFLYCDGSLVSRTGIYAPLFASTGTTFGAGDGSTTFKLPDLRGEFLRGVDSGRVLGSSQGHALDTHTHSDSFSLSSVGGHTHTQRSDRGSNPNALTSNVLGSSGGTNSAPGAQTSSSAGGHNHTVNGSVGNVSGAPTSNETRPQNVAVAYYIRYKAIASFVMVQNPDGSYETETKILSSNVVNDGTIVELTFSNLEIGRQYGLSGGIAISTLNQDTIAVRAKQGSLIVDTATAYTNGNGGGGKFSAKFTATDSTLTFEAISLTGGNVISGNSTRGSTFVQLTKLPRSLGVVAGKFAQIRTAYIDVHSNLYHNTITGTNADKTRNLDRVSGDTEFISVDLNQMKLNKGKYEIEVPLGAYAGSSWVSLAIFDVNANSNREYFSQVTRALSSDLNTHWNTVFATIETFVDDELFEFRTNASGGTGQEYISRIKVKKIR